MSTRWPVRRIVGYLLAAFAFSVGFWMLGDRRGVGLDVFDALASRNPFWNPSVRLTGLGRAGRVEVPIINLWERPGFARDNRVAARVRLPAVGELDAELVNAIEIDGLIWDEVRVNDSRGWVLKRFVTE